MGLKLPIRCVLELRTTHYDQAVLDYLTLAHIAPEPTTVTTVSRRMHRLAAAGLADVTTGWGGYQVHGLWMPGEVVR